MFVPRRKRSNRLGYLLQRYALVPSVLVPFGPTRTVLSLHDIYSKVLEMYAGSKITSALRIK